MFFCSQNLQFLSYFDIQWLIFYLQHLAFKWNPWSEILKTSWANISKTSYSSILCKSHNIMLNVRTSNLRLLQWYLVLWIHSFGLNCRIPDQMILSRNYVHCFWWCGIFCVVLPILVYEMVRNQLWSHGSALEGSDPHELAPGFEACQMKLTHIGASELTLFKSYEIGLLRIRPLHCAFEP